jgi:hypothetical protein
MIGIGISIGVSLGGLNDPSSSIIPSYLLLEDGTSFLLKEDGTSYFIL